MLSLANKDAYWRLMRADKPIGNYLLLWPTLWGLWLAADGIPPIHILVIFVLGVYLMRAAGCVINDYADRGFDGAVERTKQRPIATGEVSESEALTLFGLLIGVAFVLVLMLNWQTIAMSLVALLLASCYPFMKRYTYLPQFVLGAAFSWSIVMAFTAVQGSVPEYAWLVYIANLLWTVAYDTMYAMVDKDDDVKIGVKSTAILFAKWDRTIIGLLQLFALLLLGYVFMFKQLSVWAYVGLAAALFLFLYQHWMIRNREKPACFAAFLHNNYVGLVITAGIILSYLA